MSMPQDRLFDLDPQDADASPSDVVSASSRTGDAAAPDAATTAESPAPGSESAATVTAVPESQVPTNAEPQAPTDAEPQGVFAQRPEKPSRPKMDIAQRAKQFMPFMPLPSYPAALRMKELEVEARDQEMFSPFVEDA